jgi:hypothetical protein
MGTYVELKAKPGCEDQINAAFSAMTGNPKDFLVYSEKKIKADIAYIHSPKGTSQAHLRPYLNTVDDWEKVFPTMRLGTGEIKVSGVEDDDEARIAQIKRNIQFVLDYRMLFKTVTGLDDATRHGFCSFKGDMIEDHKIKNRPPSNEPTFSDLPKGRSEFYKQCVKYSRPDLWSAYLDFEKDPTELTWTSLRQKVIPWGKSALAGLWAKVEELATNRDGQSFGLMGRYRDGNVPSITMVRRALADI